jgi:very-short-patch-repair endonuclease
MNDLLVARLSAHGGLVTAVEAYSCGYTNDSLHRLVVSGDLFRARSGCFVDGRLLTDASTETRHALMARAVSRGYRQPHAISHVSALVVHGLPLLNFTADVVHLSLTGPGIPRTLRGLRVHPELPDSVARRCDGSRVVHPAIAVVQSAALVGVTAGVAAADAALHAGRVTKEDLEIALRIARLGPGRRDARVAVDLSQALTESPGESWARVLFVSLGLPTVEPQVVMRDERGRFVGRVDFLFRAQRTIVEFDGLVKYGGADGRQALIDEKRREDALRSLGYQVVRLTWRDLHDPGLVARLIKEAFARTLISR